MKTVASRQLPGDGPGALDTPAGDCFLMPAEWEPHAATWLAWPHNRSDWPGKYDPIPWVYAEIIRRIASGEHVHVIVNDREWERRARSVLTRAHVPVDNLTFHHWRTDRGWTRDSGAIIVRSRVRRLATIGIGRPNDCEAAQAALTWRFNAWAKYADWKFDCRIAQRMARYLGLPKITPIPVTSLGRRAQANQIRRLATGDRRLVLEGGAIDVNGCGALLTTEECMLSEDIQARNPGVSRAELEGVFNRYLGATKVIWLRRGIAGDDTHGHVDDIARFVATNTVVAAVESDRKDENYQPLRQNLKCLREATDQDGHLLRVIELPMPSPVFFRGRRLPASYANFYIANSAVLVPTFNDPRDREALAILGKLFPDRAVTGIYCGDLIWGLGAVHCMTQQQPK